MSEERFTPGPWEWWTAESWRRLYADDNGERTEVLMPTVHPIDKHPDLRVKQENMTLIAAAPCLYSALNNMLNDAINQGWGEQWTLEEASKALKKARGER